MNRDAFRFEVNGTEYDWFWILVDICRFGALFAFGIALGIAWGAEQSLGAFCGNLLTNPPQCDPLLASVESMILQFAVLGGVLLVGSFVLPMLVGGGGDG